MSTKKCKKDIFLIPPGNLENIIADNDISITQKTRFNSFLKSIHLVTKSPLKRNVV